MVKNIYENRKTETSYFSIFLAILGFILFVYIIISCDNGNLSYLNGFIINLIVLYVFFSLLHEAVHGNIGNGSRYFNGLEKIIGYISGLLVWVPYPVYYLLHRQHHTYMDDPNLDPDMWLAEKKILNLVYKAVSIKMAYTKLFWQNRSVEFKKYHKEVLIIFLIDCALFIGCGFLFNFYAVIMLWYLPTAVVFIFVSIIFAWLPHYSDFYTETNIETLPRCKDSRLLNFLLIGQNYHMLHHKYPKIHFSNYRKMYKYLLMNKGN